MKTKYPSTKRTILGCILTFLISSMPPANAYNADTHQNIVDLAYQIMRAATLTPANVPLYPHYRVGPGAEASPEWAAFIDAMTKAIDFWRTRTSLVLKLPYEGCDPLGQPDPDAHMLKDLCPVSLEENPPVGGIFNTVDKILQAGQIVPEDVPGFLDATPSFHRDYTGRILGYWAKDVDFLVEDTSLGFRPLPIGGGIGPSMKDLLDGLAGDEAGFVLLALLCIYQATIVGDDACIDLALQLLDLLGLGDDLAGLLPGIGGNFMDESVTGNWHFMLMHGQKGNYDDRPGYWIEEAGPAVGALDEAFMVFSDFVGMYLVYDDSAGTTKYQIKYQQLGDDGHTYTTLRDEGEWEYPTFGHLTFEPVDNLAFHGWRQWRNNQSLMLFGYALHALGDAAEPQHVGGSTGWGHRPFEESTSERWFWLRSLRWTGDSYSSDNEAQFAEPQFGSPEFAAQKIFADLVIQKAMEYRTFILAWRNTHPNQSMDTPIRDLVTLVAQQTHDYCFAEYAKSGWPFYDGASVQLGVDEAAAKGVYLNNKDNVALTQGLIIRSVAATIAVLTSAPEYFEP